MMFDDDFMNDMLLNPDLYGLEDGEELQEQEEDMDDYEDEDDEDI